MFVNVAKQPVAKPVVAAHVVMFAEQFLQVFYEVTNWLARQAHEP
jgi:hypothetical protein